jgi:cytochrome b subunit of formate dehydrogenase
MNGAPIAKWSACLGTWALCLGSVAMSGSLRAQTDGAPQCSSCHDQEQKLKKSAHAALSCETCHENHDKYPHPTVAGKPAPKPECAACHDAEGQDYARSVHGLAAKRGDAAPDCELCHGSAHELARPRSSEFRAAIPDTCGACHSEVVEQYKASVHGQAVARGVAQAPLCTDCHGEHSIQKHTSAASPVSTGRVTATCGSCHGNVRLSRQFGMPADRLVSFEESYHGLAAKAGGQTVANCASCHGVHNILASSDPKSTVNPKNLAKTCGQCHVGAGKRFAISSVHIGANGKEPKGVRWVRLFYWSLIPGVIGLMLAHNAGDWMRKVARVRFGAAAKSESKATAEAPELRMLGFERVQHAVLVISFLVLAWSGFALKYPDHWWARPPLLWENRWPMRSWIHRTAAIAFIAVSVAHLISLSVNGKLRGHWKELWPRRQDLSQAFQGMAYNLGLRKTRPERASHSYIEKAEYWAVAWGAIVMALSGLMLWATDFMLSMLPKEWLDLATAIHFYEAVLATLAIVVWHFYSVIFDPDVYPMDTAWFNGFSVRKRPAAETPEPVETGPNDPGKTTVG